MEATEVFSIGSHIGRVSMPGGTILSCHPERAAVAVLQPAVGRIQQVQGFGDSVVALPFGGADAAVYRFSPVVAGIPLGNPVAVPVGYISFGIGIHRIVADIALQVKGPPELLQPPGPGALPALDQPFQQAVVGTQAQVLPVSPGHDRTMMRMQRVYGYRLPLIIIFKMQGHRFLLHGQLPALVGIRIPLSVRFNFFLVTVCRIHITGCMHPAAVLVKSLVDEELSPGDGAIGVQSLLADHMHFGTEIKTGVWVDVEDSLTRFCYGRGESKSVRAGGQRLFPGQVPGHGIGGNGIRGDGTGTAVKILQFAEGDIGGTDGADAAIGPEQGVPGLEAGEQGGLHLGVRVQVEVDAIGKGVTELLQPVRGALVIAQGPGGVKDQPVQQVVIEFARSFHFGHASQFFDIVRLHAVEIVLALRIQEPEDRVGIGLAINMGDAAVVADNGDSGGLFFPVTDLLRGKGLRQQLQGEDQKQ